MTPGARPFRAFWVHFLALMVATPSVQRDPPLRFWRRRLILDVGRRLIGYWVEFDGLADTMMKRLRLVIVAFISCSLLSAGTVQASALSQPGIGPVPAGFKILSLLLKDKGNAQAVALDPTGNAAWFTNYKTSEIGRITLTGSLTEYKTPTQFSRPTDIVAGPDGDMWFTEFNSGKIGRITENGSITEVHALHFDHVLKICVGPDGALWFTGVGHGVSMVGRMTTSGRFTDFSIPAAWDI